MARKNQVESGIQQDTELYEKAIKTSEEKIKAKDYKKAIEILKAIPQEAGDYHKQGQEKLAEIENLIIEDIKEAVRNKDYKEARNLAASYKDLLPESEKLAKVDEKLKANNEDLDKLAEEDSEKEDKKETEKETETEEDTANNEENVP